MIRFFLQNQSLAQVMTQHKKRRFPFSAAYKGSIFPSLDNSLVGLQIAAPRNVGSTGDFTANFRCGTQHFMVLGKTLALCGAFCISILLLFQA